MSVTLRTKRFMTNRLLQRKQLVFDVLHYGVSGQKGVSKNEVKEALGRKYNVSPSVIHVFGLRTIYGGGKTTGFASIYDSVEAYEKVVPQYHQYRAQSKEERQKSYEAIRMARPIRRIRRSKKNEAKKARGMRKVAILKS